LKIALQIGLQVIAMQALAIQTPSRGTLFAKDSLRGESAFSQAFRFDAMHVALGCQIGAR
jgi:hypothetical protein